MSRRRGFFCPGIVEKISPGSRRFAPRFSPAAQRLFVFLALRAQFSPRPLHCRFFRGGRTPGIPRFAPLRGLAIFSPAEARPVFVSLRAPFFPRPLRGRFILGDSCPGNTPDFPASPPEFSPAAPDFFPAAVRPFFSPEQSAPCSLGISPLVYEFYSIRQRTVNIE